MDELVRVCGEVFYLFDCMSLIKPKTRAFDPPNVRIRPSLALCDNSPELRDRT